MIAPLLAWLLALPALGATTSGDAQVLGQLATGAEVPTARLEVRLSSSDAYGLLVSSADGRPMLHAGPSGRVAVGVSSPTAALDLRGSADNGDIGLLVRAGNSSGTASSAQFAFSPSVGLYQHSLRTRATSYGYFGNGIDFYLWRSTAEPATLGASRALSLESVDPSTASFHVQPTGAADAQLEVSRGTITGGGYMLSLPIATHSSRARKFQIEPLGDRGRAYADLLGMRHARFRFKGQSDVLGGLIYEDVPESVTGPGETVVLDYRVLNLVMALQKAHERIRALEGELLAGQGKKGGSE
ncbi:MAG: hypothetical protein HY554_00605 [Elusimicrobia bacterium]|nr:hypothetical protein [Elusimicrobiota bacterium]